MAGKKRIKVILDTNWFVSATINRKSRRNFYDLIVDERFEIQFSKQLLDEYTEVIYREKFRKFITPEQIRRFFRLVLLKLTEVTIKSQVQLSRDIKDNYLLSMAIDGETDYLVTGDQDLLIIRQIGKTKIVTMADFLVAIQS